MPTTPSKWTWLVGPSPGTICKVFVTYVPARDKYACSVLTSGHLEHHWADTPEAALEAGKTYVADTFGEIRQERPAQTVADLRIGRWNGGPLLLGDSRAIHLLEDWVQTASRCNTAQVQGFFGRDVRPELNDKQRAILDVWLSSGNWERVPTDALFAFTFPDYDYLTD